MMWDFSEAPMKDSDCLSEKNIEQHTKEPMFAHDPETTKVERMWQTLDAKCSPVNLEAEADKCQALDLGRKSQVAEFA